ncbi:MAG: RNA-splicing factor [Vezdaea aestivalis]|nr:MAG: RNA-splicing factor [Vezdaea aestivalis]
MLASRPLEEAVPAPYPRDFDKYRPRKPDAEILDHDRKRQVEVKVLEERIRLEDEEVPEEEIEERTQTLREKLLKESERSKSRSGKGLKPHQVHELAEAKIEESERLRKALGISKDYEEGSHWKKQEERMRDSLADPQLKDGS